MEFFYGGRGGGSCTTPRVGYGYGARRVLNQGLCWRGPAATRRTLLHILHSPAVAMAGHLVPQLQFPFCILSGTQCYNEQLRDL
jgi:hypothetical protein